MNLSQTFAWDHASSSPLLVKCIFQKIINFFSKEKFNHESEIPNIDHSFKFIKRYKYKNISNEGIVCRIFILTFQDQIRKWFNAFTIESIHSGNSPWNYFYAYIRTMTMMSYVMKLNIFREKNKISLLILIRGLYRSIIDFTTMINYQRNLLIRLGYFLFVILF